MTKEELIYKHEQAINGWIVDWQAGFITARELGEQILAEVEEFEKQRKEL